mmetsp:Transcript_36697/g.105831  ORF Transcript_36697/g.105831 Transcript_36697/m.105831 type:complete len:233 (+) Transcript_36697:535-1233(+)
MDLLEQPAEVGAVASDDLHIIHSVEAVVRERQGLVVVGLNESQSVGHPGGVGIFSRGLQLVQVDVDAGDVGARLLSHEVRDAASAAADVQDLGRRPDFQIGGHALLIQPLVRVGVLRRIQHRRKVHLLVIPDGAQMIQGLVVVFDILHLLGRASEGVHLEHLVRVQEILDPLLRDRLQRDDGLEGLLRAINYILLLRGQVPDPHGDCTVRQGEEVEYFPHQVVEGPALRAKC